MCDGPAPDEQPLIESVKIPAYLHHRNAETNA